MNYVGTDLVLNRRTNGSSKPKRIDKDEVGTLVKINGQKFDEISFSANPQLQLDRHQEKLNQLAENSARDFALRPVTSQEFAHGAATGDRVGYDIARVSQIPTTAAQVGARPNTWIPTATDLGLSTNAQNDARFLRTGSNLGSQVVGVGTLVSFDGGINVLNPGRDSFTARQPATTGWVQGQMAQSTDAAGVNSMPIASGRTANRGTSNRLARADHRHPVTLTALTGNDLTGVSSGTLTVTNLQTHLLNFAFIGILASVTSGITGLPGSFTLIPTSQIIGSTAHALRANWTLQAYDGTGNSYAGNIRFPATGNVLTFASTGRMRIHQIFGI